MLERLGNVPRTYIWIILLILIAAPLLRPLGLPLKISPMVREFYAALDNIQPGDVVFCAWDLGIGVYAEEERGVYLTVQKLFDMPGVKILGASLKQEGLYTWEDTLRKVDKGDKEYGKDWVWLGWISGGETGAASFAANVHGTSPTDDKGTPLDDLEMMADITTAADIDILISFTVGAPGLAEWLKQASAPYNIPTLSVSTAVSIPKAMAYYPHDVQGILGGLRAYAELEKLTNMLGYATAAADVLSTTHIYVLLLIFMGNIAYLSKKYRGES